MESIDCFVRIFDDEDAPNMIRRGMTMAVVARWEMQKDVNLHFITNRKFSTYPNQIVIPPAYFHIESKRIAEQEASTPIYIVADDDCLIIGEQFVKIGLALMENRDYGIIAAHNITEGPHPIEPIRECHSVGGVLFVRKGILSEFDRCSPQQVDGVIYDEMRSKGYRSGIAQGARFNHLGARYSLVTPGYWNA